MKPAVQEALETAALILGSAFLFAIFFKFNAWLFSDLIYRDGISWVFLPAGFRVILVLVLGLPGALGIVLGHFYLDRDLIQSSLSLVVVNGLVSGLTPFVMMKLLGKGMRSGVLLQSLNPQRLLQFTLVFAGATAFMHQLSWTLMRRDNVNMWVDVWPMFIGDALGALLMLYCFKFVFSCFRPKAF